MEKLSLDKFKDFSVELNQIYGGKNIVPTGVVTGCDDGTTEGDGTEPDDLDAILAESSASTHM